MRTKWSQNFLTDGNIAKKCVASLHLEPVDRVLEIGPGKGMLTELILRSPVMLTAIEIDPDLCSGLKSRFGHSDHFALFCKDVLEISPENTPLIQSVPYKIIGNLPYAVTSPILQKILEWPGWVTAVLMVQKEVARRICARPGGKEYGVLSVSVQSRSLPEIIFNVSRLCFRPVPKVESTLLRLTPLQKPVFDTGKENAFFKVVKGSFAHRRKTLLNSLCRALDLTRERVEEALKNCSIDPDRRAETLSLTDFKNLSEMIKFPDAPHSL